MAKSTYPKNGEGERKKTSFCQRVFDRRGFLDFCSELRRLPSYASQWEVLDWIDDSNRLVFPVDSVPVFPEFLSNFRSKTWSGPGYDMEWTTGPICDDSTYRDLDRMMRNVGGDSDLFKVLSLSGRIGRYPVEFSFNWTGTSPICNGFNINWFFGGFFRLDDFSKEAIRNQFGAGRKSAVPSEYRKNREKEVKETLSFLSDFRIIPGSEQLDGRSLKPDEVWRSFLDWSDRPQIGLDFQSRVFLKQGPVTTPAEWDLTEIKKLLRFSGGKEVCIDFEMQNLVSKGGANYDLYYHEWIAGLGGCRTLSGKCAVFAIGAIGESPYGVVNVYLSPAGYVVGYIKIGSNNAKPPPDLVKLVSDSEWIRGKPPGEEGFAHPIYGGTGEASDPVPGVDAEVQIKVLRQELKKWTPPERECFEPNSFEGQYEKLAELGFKQQMTGERDDYLERHERSWYENLPYLNMLLEMGEQNPFTACHRFWHGDAGKLERDLNPREIMVVLNVLTATSLPFTGLKCSSVPGPLQCWKVDFDIGNEHFAWTLDEAESWSGMDIIMEFNSLLRSYGSGHLIYCIKLDHGEMLLSGLKSEEAAALNGLLPKPFVIADDT